MYRVCISAVFFASILALATTPSAADSWPQWRGPSGRGVSAEQGLPTTWSRTENILWKAEMPGPSASTPIVDGGRVFVTVQVGTGPLQNMAMRGDDANAPVPNEGEYEVLFKLVCYDAKNGEVLWEREEPASLLAPTHAKHDGASPSCATDGERVYSWYAHGPVSAHDFEGNLLWRRDLAAENGPFDIRWGHASSPVVHGDRLILQCDHANAYLLALDKLSGEEIWRTSEGLNGRSYSTPLILDTGDREELVCNTQNGISAYDPYTGKLLWTCEGLGRVVSPSPSFADGVIYTSGGSRNSTFLAIRPGGNGDVTESHVVWEKPNGAPYTSSLLYAEGFLFSVDTSRASCFDAATGELVWRERIGGEYSASPVYADGKVYVVSEAGVTTVFEPSPEFRRLATNDLGERTLASPAIAGGRIFIRTDENLYCIGSSPE